ncbi:cyclase family protein [Prauserella muralis]|nr:cyclase family protein [Prauserella muralis]TWE28602.1 putative cyclase [Prauserella muralis]
MGTTPTGTPAEASGGEGMGLPAFAELPFFEGWTERHSWGVYGPKDDFGALNNVTPERIAQAATEVRSGERVSLQLPPALPDPPLYGRSPLIHKVVRTGRNSWDDRLDCFYPQRATQWDGFRHVRFREFGFYGGVTEDPPEMGDRLGIHHWAHQGVMGRGVLLDVAAYLEHTGGGVDPFAERAITASELRAVAAHQTVTVRPGDILCIRTGWATRYKSASYAQRAVLAEAGGRPAFIGLSAAESTAALLWDWHVGAVAADNPAVESAPGDPRVGSLHRRVLVQLGIPLGELFDFDELARRCAYEDRWTFFFVSTPLAIAGGVGSPANPVAIR